MVADGVDTMNKIGALVEEIEQTLNEEKENLEQCSDNWIGRENCEGWVEALQYVLRQIEYIVE